MTEVMNFFQAIFMFKQFTPAAAASRQEVKLAIALKEEAQSFAKTADEEMKNGVTAQTLSIEAADANKARCFTGIAVWHHNRAAEKYRRAAERFEEAGRIYTKKSRAFREVSGEMMRRACRAEANVDRLQNLLKQN